MTSPFSHLIDQVTLDAPWSLVEAFSTMPRWKPQDVETAAYNIAERLKALDVPVKLLESNLHLSIPFTALSIPSHAVKGQVNCRLADLGCS